MYKIEDTSSSWMPDEMFIKGDYSKINSNFFYELI